MTAAIILLYSTRTTPVTVGQTEKIYNEYAKKHEGIADQTLIEALQQEKEQFDKLRQRQVELTEKWRKEEVSDEQYASINALIDRMLQNEAGLMRAIEQANTLVSWSKAHDYQLFFTDDSIGRYLFENANMDQYRGAVLLFIVIVLLSGIFPGERKNEMQNMLLCTKNGRRPLFVAKYVLGVVIACIVSGGFTVIHLFSASKMYDFSLWEVPLQSIRQAQVIDVQLSVRGYLVWTSVMQMMGVVCAAISFLSISVWMKNRLYAVLAGAVLFVLPVIASGAGMSNIFGLWFAKVFLFGTQTLKQGFGVQIGYLILLVAVASVFTAGSSVARISEKKESKMIKMELKNLTKSYEKGKIALDHFSAALEPGVYGLLGPNGAGKSTLMNLITQNLEPDEGEILINGISTAKMGASYRDVLGYMPQQQGLYDRFSALEFLRYFAALKGLKAKESRKRIEELLEVVNLTEARNRKLGGFSGGMKQRVLLAQALLNEPQILILDEPTAGLDPKERIRIRNYISSISENKIVLIATHVVSDVECIAKEILLLRSGKLLEKETPEKLVEQMEELVWEVIIRPDQLSELEQVLLVSNVNIAKEGLLVRVIAELEQMKEQQIQFGWGTPKAAVPTLEDVYLWNMGT